ncbi:hypothetical protein F4805DRAFT_473849 [Annulohypoxylon moriforme]|nr:hypothetical protein F4805DRAFT_473849 [Annulohypoxylon moriforme]
MAYRGLAEVRPVEGIGYGLFATRDIPKGTLILDEAPLMSLRDEKRNENFCNAYQKLTHEAKIAYHKLHLDPARYKGEQNSRATYVAWALKQCGGPITEELRPQFEAYVEEVLRGRALFWTNCAQTGVDRGAAVYLDFSRINHSCDPSCNWSTYARDGTYRLYVRAKKNIKAGEQLFITYDFNGSNLTRPLSLEQRRARLRPWGFECACTRCLAEERGLKRKADSLLDELSSPSANTSKPTHWTSASNWTQPKFTESEDELARGEEDNSYELVKSSLYYRPVQLKFRTQYPTAEQLMNRIHVARHIQKKQKNAGVEFIDTTAAPEQVDPHRAELVRSQLQMNANLTREVANLIDTRWGMPTPSESNFPTHF